MRVTIVTLAPLEVQTVRAYPTRMLQSWQDSRHKGSPLGGVWNARFAHDASLSVCCPLQAFSLSKLLQESVDCLKVKAETMLVHKSSANSINFPVELMICNKSYANQAIFSDYYTHMTKASQFLKVLKAMKPSPAAKEINKLGVYVKQRTSKEQLHKIIDELDPALVQKHLTKMEAPPNTNILTDSTPINDKIPFFLPENERLVQDLKQIHQNYLNQYSQRINKHKPLPPQKSTDFINGLLGIRTEIFFDPKHIIHEYQNDSMTFKQKFFPTFQNEKYIKRLKVLKRVPSSWKKFVDAPTSQQRILLSYGFRKENEFYLGLPDLLQDLIYPGQIKHWLKRKELILKFVNTFHQQIGYYGAVIASLTIPNIASIITIFKAELNKIQLNPIILHNFTLTFSGFILENPLFAKSLRFNNAFIQQIQQWIYGSIRAFRSSLQYDQLDLSLKDIFLQTLKRYIHIKKILLKNPFFNQVPQDVLIGTEQCQWPENMISKVETAVPEVGVAELAGRRVSDKLKNTKLVIELAADEELEIPLLLLEKLVMSVRSGVEWIKYDPEGLQQSLLTSEVDFFFDKKLCCSIIKMIFINGEVSIDLQQVVQFLWTRFFHLSVLDQQSIQSMFLLANVTIRYKYAQIFKENNEPIYKLLTCSINTIFKQGFQALKKPKVINFLQQEAILLLNDLHKQQLLNFITEVSQVNTPK